MDENFGSGYRVNIGRCEHQTTIEIFSYESARIEVNPNGALTFECTDVSTLFGSSLPSRNTMMAISALMGMAEEPELPDGPCHHDEKVLLFSDELSLELWLREDFLPNLSLFGEDGPIPEDAAGELIGRLTRKIMAETLATQAGDRVRRTWQA